MECHDPPAQSTEPTQKKRKGTGVVSRTSLLIVQQRWVVSELITLAPKTLIGLKLCQSRQHAWGPCRQQNGWCYTGPEKERKKGTTDLNSGGGPRDGWTKEERTLTLVMVVVLQLLLVGAQTKKKRHCSRRWEIEKLDKMLVELWGGDLDKEKIHCSLRWEILEKLDKMLVVVLWEGPDKKKKRKRHTAL